MLSTSPNTSAHFTTLKQWRDLGYDLQSSTANPNLNAKNYVPQMPSGAIQTATNLSSYFKVDIDGTARPLASAWDIGAAEHTADGPPVAAAIPVITSASTAKGSVSPPSAMRSRPSMPRTERAAGPPAGPLLDPTSGASSGGMPTTLDNFSVADLGDQLRWHRCRHADFDHYSGYSGHRRAELGHHAPGQPLFLCDHRPEWTHLGSAPKGLSTGLLPQRDDGPDQRNARLPRASLFHRSHGNEHNPRDRNRDAAPQTSRPPLLPPVPGVPSEESPPSPAAQGKSKSAPAAPSQANPAPGGSAPVSAEDATPSVPTARLVNLSARGHRRIRQQSADHRLYNGRRPP